MKGNKKHILFSENQSKQMISSVRRITVESLATKCTFH